MTHPRRGDARGSAHSGQMMVVFALTLVVLIGALALGVDLSRLRTEAENAQHAANAAALAGVPFMATSQATAFSRAQEEAAKNGMTNGAQGVVVTPALVSGYNYRLRVTISESVTLFFAHVLGLGPMRISRSATAEFLPPLGLGSPDYVLGYPAFPTTVIPGTTPENFYLNSSGPYDIKENGDPYSPLFESYNFGNAFNYSGPYSNRCAACQSQATVDGSGGTGATLTQNALSHPPSYFSGYNYIIDDPVSNTLMIKLFDPYAEGPYDLSASNWDSGYSTSVAPPVASLAPSDIQPMSGGTCVLGTDTSTGSRCRSELVDATGATVGQFGNHPTTLQFTLSGPYRTAWDPTTTLAITATPPTTGDMACVQPGHNCVIAPSFATGEDPATPGCTRSSCQRSTYAYKFINYAVIHGPGIFKLNVNAVVNVFDTAYATSGTYGTEHNSYGVAVCNTVNDPTYRANPLGLSSNPVASDPMTTTNGVSTPAGPTTLGWNPLSCPSPNDPTTCPTPRLSPANACVHLYAAGTMPVYNLLSTGASLIPLGYIPPDYAGKTINLDLFDPGDIDNLGGSSGCPVRMVNCIEVLTPAGDLTYNDGRSPGNDPNDGTPYLANPSYTWTAAPDIHATGYYSSTTTAAATTGAFDIGINHPYNGTWIHMKISIPQNYADMVAQYGGYWKILYRIGGAGHDATTWGLNVAGSTVHLVVP